MLMERLRRFHRADIALNDRWFGRTPLHPTFWVKRRVGAALRGAAAQARGVLLDAGCGMMPHRALFEGRVTRYIGVEWTPQSGYAGNRAELCGDLQALPVAAGTVDTVLCTEVLEHVPDPDAVMRELSRVLKPGGTLILTAPFVFPVHEARDYFRYNAEGFRSLLARHELEPVTVRALGGAPTTIAMLSALYLMDGCFLWNRWTYPLSLPLRPLLLGAVAAINLLGGLIERLGPAYPLPCNHLVVARRQPAGAAPAAGRHRSVPEAAWA